MKLRHEGAPDESWFRPRV